MEHIKSHQSHHVVTGGTGFVGSAIILELLKEKHNHVIALVRTSKDQQPEARLKSVLADVVNSCGLKTDIILDGIENRLSVWESDLTLPGCGVIDISFEEDVNFWHCAASLQYEDRHKDAIFEMNVAGTKNVLELARKLNTKSFNHLSTAYVAGKADGVIKEAPVEQTRSNNHYEISKIEGERIVLGETAFPTRILRPSIVVGHSQTMYALNYNGMYGFIRNLVKFKGAMERAQQGVMERTRLKLFLDPESTINVIPVDFVAQQAVAIGSSNDYGIFHLTNATPPKLGESINQMFDLVGIRRPEFTTDKSQFTWLDKQFSRRVDFYESYLVGDKNFDRSNTDKHLPDVNLKGFRMEGNILEEFFSWYLDLLYAGRSALPVSR